MIQPYCYISSHRFNTKSQNETHNCMIIVDQPQKQFSFKQNTECIFKYLFSMASATVFAATRHLHILISNRVWQLCLPCCLQYLFTAFIHSCLIVHIPSAHMNTEYMSITPHMKCTKNPRTSLVIPIHPSCPRNILHTLTTTKNVINNTSLWVGVILVSVWTPPSWRLMRTLLLKALIQNV